MSVRHETAEDQSRLWNGPAARGWVQNQDLLDRVFRPLEALLVDSISGSQTRVLDVGCGTGGTTLAAARQLGANGESIGIDISEPMIAVARARAEREAAPARFICADAQETHAVLRFRQAPATRERAAAFVAAESRCCAFLRMQLRDDPDALTLTIDGPPGSEPVVAEMVAAFAP